MVCASVVAGQIGVDLAIVAASAPTDEAAGDDREPACCPAAGCPLAGMAHRKQEG